MKNAKNVLLPLIDFIQKKINNKQSSININFICTHNSRRAIFHKYKHRLAAAYFNIPEYIVIPSGTKETALFPKVTETLKIQGFNILKISESSNPVYAIKYIVPILCLLLVFRKNMITRLTLKICMLQ